MKKKIKWLFTIARKNDIPKEEIYRYMEENHGKDSVRKLTHEEMDDVLKFVSDSRLVTFEKQIFMLIKKGEEIGVDRDHLNNLSKKFGAHNIEELDEKGIKGLIAIVNSMEKKYYKNLPRFTVSNETTVGDSGYKEYKMAEGTWVSTPHKDGIFMSHEDYPTYKQIVDICGDPIILPNDKQTLSNVKGPMQVEVNGTELGWLNGRGIMMMYVYKGKGLGFLIKGEVIYDSGRIGNNV